MNNICTFLFTDIEGSTRRWEADPDVMRVALEAHNEALRGAIEMHAGRVFNYTGDGMCAVFDSPRAAVDAAIAAQRALELPVRMGIATGEAETRGGETDIRAEDHDAEGEQQCRQSEPAQDGDAIHLSLCARASAAS